MDQAPIQQQLTTLLNQSLKRLGLPKTAEIVMEQANRDHGDYAANVAMVLFAQSQKENTQLKYSNPRELADAIVSELFSELDANPHSAVAKVAVAGPGFINFTLSEHFLAAKAAQLAADPAIAAPKPEKRQKIVVEYSSPNIAKPFTVGHLRSTIIGDAVANLLEAVGHQIYRDNHLGDWGTQFGKQIFAIKEWGDESVIEAADNPVQELVKLYVKFHEEAEKNPELEEAARAWFKKLEDGDPEARRLWQRCISWSWQEFDKIYQRLGVKFTENDGLGYGESFFEDKMAPVVAELKESGLLQESEGAQLVFFPDEKYPPLMILKRDGSTLYATRDLATDKFRFEHYGQDAVIINETGAEQSLYFQQIFEIERLLGWCEPHQRVHIGHGLFRLKAGKMSTRKGNVIWLESVLQEAFDRVDQVSAADLDQETKWQIAVGALKWNDLKRSPHLPITFDWDEVLSLKGNSGPYMQYTHVRAESILVKAAAEWNFEVTELKSDITKHIDTLLNLLTQKKIELSPTEKELLRNIYSYYDTFAHSVSEYSPHHLANYLYELAQQFNTFYNGHVVVDESAAGAKSVTDLPPQTQLRLLLTVATASVIEHGLGVLGIETVEKM